MSSFFDPFTKFLIVTIIAIFIVVGWLSGGTFLDIYNIQSMGFQMAEIGLLSFAMMLAMMSGNSGIDLSVVGIAILSSVFAGLIATILVGSDAPALFTLVFIIAAIFMGLLCGALNGFLIAKVGYTPILATLGSQLVFLGISVGLTGGAAMTFKYSQEFTYLGNEMVAGIPIPIIILTLATLFIVVVLEVMPFGKRYTLMGTNPLAARFAGLDTKRLVIITYTLTGLFAGLAGVIMSSRSNGVKWDYGSSYLLIAILTVVMAGVHPNGGKGRVVNVVLASIALQLLSSTFSILEFPAYLNPSFLKDFTWGLLLIVSIAVPKLLSASAFPSILFSKTENSEPEGGAKTAKL